MPGHKCHRYIIEIIILCTVHIYAYVTGLRKTDQIVTLGLFHFSGPANGHTRTLHILSRLGGLVCFSRVSFANPINSWLRQWDPCGGCYIDGFGLKFTPVVRDVLYALQACLGLWLALLGPIANPNSPNWRFNLPLASHPRYPPPPSNPPPPTHPPL